MKYAWVIFLYFVSNYATYFYHFKIIFKMKMWTRENQMHGKEMCWKHLKSYGKESSCKAEDPGSIPGLEDPLEKGMATYSNILAWRIPWTEEPGRLQSMGSQKIKHNWGTNIFTFFSKLIHCVKQTTQAKILRKIMICPDIYNLLYEFIGVNS